MGPLVCVCCFLCGREQRIDSAPDADLFLVLLGWARHRGRFLCPFDAHLTTAADAKADQELAEAEAYERKRRRRFN